MLEKPDSNTKGTTQIYIRLLDEGTDVWRPTQAEDMGNGLFRILPTWDYNAEDEVWEFLPGSIVRCQVRNFEEGYLVAVEKV